MTSEASGKYDIATIMARVFPSFRTFASKVLRGMDLPVPAGPYAGDTITRKSSRVVEYNTVARAEGLGNDGSWLGKNELPIRGAAIIVGNPPNVRAGPDLILLSVRLDSAFGDLASVIVDQFERDTIRGPGK
jgi:hypothetical protein